MPVSVCEGATDCGVREIRWSREAGWADLDGRCAAVRSRHVVEDEERAFIYCCFWNSINKRPKNAELKRCQWCSGNMLNPNRHHGGGGGGGGNSNRAIA